MNKKSIFKRIADAGLTWLGDWLIEHWPSVLIVFVGSGGMGYLASTTNWVTKYGPIALGITVLSSILLMSICYYLFAKSRESNVLASISQRRLLSNQLNALDKQFDNQRIKLVDLYHPFQKPVDGVRFINCEFYGPSLIFFGAGVKYNKLHFEQCEIMIVKEGISTNSLIFFNNCYFEECTFYQATLSMTKEDYLDFSRVTKANPVNVISDGTAGNF